MGAAPTGLVEGKTDGIDDGILRADVEIGSSLHVAKRTPEEHILEVLGVGGNCHAAAQFLVARGNEAGSSPRPS